MNDITAISGLSVATGLGVGLTVLSKSGFNRLERLPTGRVQLAAGLGMLGLAVGAVFAAQATNQASAGDHGSRQTGAIAGAVVGASFLGGFGLMGSSSIRTAGLILLGGALGAEIGWAVGARASAGGKA